MCCIILSFSFFYLIIYFFLILFIIVIIILDLLRASVTIQFHFNWNYVVKHFEHYRMDCVICYKFDISLACAVAISLHSLAHYFMSVDLYFHFQFYIFVLVLFLFAIAYCRFANSTIPTCIDSKIAYMNAISSCWYRRSFRKHSKVTYT